jgi:hypothetical protein
MRFLRAEKIKPDSSSLSSVKPDTAELWDDTRLVWLQNTDLNLLLATLSEKNGGISTFLDNHKNILRKLPHAKRTEITQAIIAYGSVTDLNFLAENDSSAFSSNAIAASLPPPLLVIATQRENVSMIRAVADFLWDKLKDENRRSRHAANVISAELKAVLHTKAGLFKSLALAYLRQIIERAWCQKLISAEEFKKTFFYDNRMPSTEMAHAIFNGDNTYIRTLNKTLLSAHKNRILNAAELTELLCGTCSHSPEAHVLVHALKTNNAEAVVVFDDILSQWRRKEVLTAKQAADLVILKADHSIEWLLNHTDAPTANAYRKIVEHHALPPIAPDVALAAA